MGMGFVGLTTAAFFSSRGIPVIGIEIDEIKNQKIREGWVEPYFHEDGLKELLDQVPEGYLKVGSDYNSAIKNTDMTMIAVGTPSDEQGKISLRFVESAARSIGIALIEKPGWHLVVVKSTVVPGTTRDVGRIIAEESGKIIGQDLGLCSNPEFLKEGSAVKDSLEPDRVMIGGFDEKSSQALAAFYQQIYKDRIAEKKTKIFCQGLENAELVKYTANSLLALKISFANEIATIAEKIPGVDVKEVMKGVFSDYRINREFLNAGLGFGGSCFPKDVIALLNFAIEKGCLAPILHALLQVNNNQVIHTIEIIEKILGGLNNKKIAILGLAFKPNTDDLREARSTKLVSNLLNKGARIFVTDPKVKYEDFISELIQEDAKRYNQVLRTILTDPSTNDEKKVHQVFQNTLKQSVTYGTIEECLEQASACILVTEWPEYNNISPKTFQSLMREPKLLFDGRRIYNALSFKDFDVKYQGIGLGAADT